MPAPTACVSCNSPVAAPGRDSVKFACNRWVYLAVAEQWGEQTRTCLDREVVRLRAHNEVLRNRVDDLAEEVRKWRVRAGLE